MQLYGLVDVNVGAVGVAYRAALAARAGTAVGALMVVVRDVNAVAAGIAAVAGGRGG